MKPPFAPTRVQYVVNLISPSSSMKLLNIGVSNIPEIELAVENKVKECWTLDNDQKKLDYAQKLMKKTKTVNADVTKPLAFKNGYFDTIVMLEVLEHLDHDEKILRQLNSLISKDGHLIMSVPNKDMRHIINPVKYTQHKRHYAAQELKRKLSDAGFDVEHFNVVESWSLLGNLYLHLFNKYLLGRKIEFNFFDKTMNRTYLQQNKRGLDFIVKARKIRNVS